MRLSRVQKIVLAPLVLFALFYLSLVVVLLPDDATVAPLSGQPAGHHTVAIFGASGTAGDGILKAALANPDIDEIHVVTRRTTPRIDAGIASGKVKMTLHLDYLDYSAIHEQIVGVDAAYWAIGTSSAGVGQTKEEAHIGQSLLYWFFAPVSSAVRATQIGEAMFEVTERESEFGNGDRLGTRSIIRYSDAYKRRQGATAKASLAEDMLYRHFESASALNS